MPKRIFKIGDKVRIREWDDMAREYGEEFGDIKTRIRFVGSMRKLCGMKFTIENVDTERCGFTTYLDREGSVLNQWLISGEMLEPEIVIKREINNINGISSLFE